MVDLKDKLVKETIKTSKEMIDSLIVTDEEKKRMHLGVSEIGEECHRKLFLKFRWFDSIVLTPQKKRLFEFGKLREEYIVEKLKKKYQVWDSIEGKQIGVFDKNNHCFRGSVDFIIKGLYHDPETPYLGEIKTYNKTRFAKLKKEGVKASDFKYYIQVQGYMYYLKLTKSIFIAECKDNSEIYIEFIEKVNDDFFEDYQILASRVVNGTISDFPRELKATDYRCKMCDLKSVCHGAKKPEKNCRTCSYSTPDIEDNEKWICKFEKINAGSCYVHAIDFEQQQKACDNYLAIEECN